MSGLREIVLEEVFKNEENLANFLCQSGLTVKNAAEVASDFFDDDDAFHTAQEFVDECSHDLAKKFDQVEEYKCNLQEAMGEAHKLENLLYEVRTTFGIHPSGKHCRSCINRAEENAASNAQ